MVESNWDFLNVGGQWDRITTGNGKIYVAENTILVQTNKKGLVECELHANFEIVQNKSGIFPIQQRV